MDRTTDFFHVGGTLSDDALCYIERPADKELLKALERRRVCLVLAPRQTGKSSLMVHAQEFLNKKNICVGIVDFQLLGPQRDSDELFCNVIQQIEDSLKLKTDTCKWWNHNNRFIPARRFMNFLEDVVLVEKSGKVVLFFDEIDLLLKLSFSDDFFTAIRSTFNAGATNPTLKRLNFALLGFATAASFSKDRTHTPFNVVQSISLDDFDRKSTKSFFEVFGADSQSLIDRIFYWTNGAPLLVQRLSETAFDLEPKQRTAERIDDAVNVYCESRIEQDTHLNSISDYLCTRPAGHRRIPGTDWANPRDVLEVYMDILEGREVIEDKKSPVHDYLQLSGVVRVKDKKFVIRNRIYGEIFNLQWVQEKIRQC